jgi:antitoxin component YwqK of YwqJK toxin-antitoxin module
MLVSLKSLKSIFVFLLFAVSMGACKNKEEAQTQSDTQEIKENYGTGETSRVFTRVNGKIEGKMTDYYPSGKIMGERFFENDKQIGKTTLYYEDGTIKEVQYYENGLKNGGDTVFYENGKPKFAVTLKDEKKNGYLRKWDEEGALIYEAKFQMDTLVEVGGESTRK